MTSSAREEACQLILDLAESLVAVSHVCHLTNGVDYEMPEPLRSLLRRVDALLEIPDEPDLARIDRIEAKAKELLAWMHKEQLSCLEIKMEQGRYDDF